MAHSLDVNLREQNSVPKPCAFYSMFFSQTDTTLLQNHVCVSLGLYTHHSKTNVLERKHGTLGFAGTESERVTNQLGLHKKPSTVQSSAHQFARLRCDQKLLPTPTDSANLHLQVTSLEMQQFHHTHSLAMGKTAPTSLQIDCARVEHNTFA